MPKTLFALSVVLLQCSWLSVGRAELAVLIDFPAGSGKVERIDQSARRIWITPSPHDGKGWECWWFIRVEGLKPGETIMVDVGPAPWSTPNQAAVSEDGVNWRQTAIGKRRGKRIQYQVKVRANSMYVAWGPPFTPGDALALVDRASSKKRAIKFKLCNTRGNRPVWALHFQPEASKPTASAAPANPAPRFGIWIQARQHAWEAGSSWVCQGLVDWLSSDDPESQWLRERADIYVVPIMDVDSVAIGAGGKNQNPHDHNRDWSDKPHWPAVAAAQKRIATMDQKGRFHLFVDLHNPDASARRPYFYVTPRSQLPAQSQLNLKRFLAAVSLKMTGPLQFQGRTQESGASYDANWRAISKNWVSHHTNQRAVAVTLETAWNTPHSTQKGYLTVGRQLAEAITHYLRDWPDTGASD